MWRVWSQCMMTSQSNNVEYIDKLSVPPIWRVWSQCMMTSQSNNMEYIDKFPVPQFDAWHASATRDDVGYHGLAGPQSWNLQITSARKWRLEQTHRKGTDKMTQVGTFSSWINGINLWFYRETVKDIFCCLLWVSFHCHRIWRLKTVILVHHRQDIAS